MTAPVRPVSPRTGRQTGPLEASLEAKNPLRDISSERMSQIRDSVIAGEAKRQGVPVNIALAVAQVENERGIPWAVSPSGDVGIMQVNPSAHPEAPTDSLAQPGFSARVGVSILAEYKRRYGTWERTLMAYNGSLHKPQAGAEYVRRVKAKLTAMGGQNAQGTRAQVGSAGALLAEQGKPVDVGAEDHPQE